VRTLLAFLVAPILSALVPTGFSFAGGINPPLFVFAVFCGAFFVLQIVVGIPAYLLLGRTKRQHVWFSALVGFGVVALPYLLYALYRGEKGYELGEILFLTCLVGLLGAGNGLMFWLIARPDRVVENAQPKSNRPVAE
jgi:hypothetical protein